jgi:hypothetical protein
MIDLGTSTTRITIPSGWSFVRVGFYVRFTGSIATCFANIKRNGSFLAATHGLPEFAATAQALQAWSDYIAVNSGDYFELNTFAATSRTVSAAWLAVELVS